MTSPGALGADQHTLEVLELPALLARVASLAQTTPGAQRVTGLRPTADLAVARRRLARLDQLRKLLEETSGPNLGNLEHLPALFSRLEVAGAYLLPDELAQVAEFLAAVGRAAAFLDSSEERFQELYRLRNRLTPLPEMLRRIHQVVGQGGGVKSSASPELARLRGELASTRDRLREQMNSLVGSRELAGALSDQVVTLRGDRFVVPVKVEARSKVPGIIHDSSGSGATYFVEPLEAVEGNNQLALLRRKEAEEVERILLDLAYSLSGQLQALGEDLEALADLDCLLAQAAFCARLHCLMPELNDQGHIELNKARHPLLAWRESAGKGRAVPISLAMGREVGILVISGANAGGKTAALKTLGLLTLMAMSGLHVPCDVGTRLAVFDSIMAEAGDEQSLEGDLSTFTGHASRLAWMVEHAGPGTLALIDELGGGTDPNEGAALGVAVLEWLKQREAQVVCTTHFHRLKAFAATTEGVVNVSVAFDQATGQPTYQLTVGLPGVSDALAVSRGLGFPQGLVDRAELELEEGERQTVALLREAEKARQEADSLQAQARSERMAAGEEREQAKRLLDQARRERAQALSEGRRRVREVARRLEDRLKTLWERVSEVDEQQPVEDVKPGRVRQKLYQARREAMDELEDQVGLNIKAAIPAGPTRPIAELAAGDPVRLLALGQRGVLLEDPRPGQDKLMVAAGPAGLRVTVPVDQMEALPRGAKPPTQAKPRPRPVHVEAMSDDGLDLKVIGMTVDEALPLVDKALDQALLAGRGDIKVVHGVGTGRLRRAVRDYLREHPNVVSAGQPEGPGSAGVTVAHLRG